MSAKKLIKIAEDKGLSIGRNRSNEYRYGYSNGQEYKQFTFFGTWSEFSKFIAEVVAPQPGSKMFNEVAK